MRKSILRSTICAIAFLGAATFTRADETAASATAPDPFEGEWQVTATPDEDTAGEGQGKFQEAVLFHDSQFSAAVFAMFGFTPSDYSVSADNSGTHFTATLISSDRGTLEWNGVETPTGLDGTLVWTRDDGHAMHYTINGERQQN